MTFIAIFPLELSASINEELEIINTFLANPDVGQKLYGDTNFEVLEGWQ